MQIRSTAFAEGDTIPRRFTCDGSNQSPPLSWADSPPNTRSFALIADDPDAPRGTFTHWVIYRIPPGTTNLPAAVPTDARLENGARQGVNTSGQLGYTGPCPPPGPAHRYQFTVYALDAELDLPDRPDAAAMRKAMNGHILAQSTLRALYGRS